MQEPHKDKLLKVGAASVMNGEMVDDWRGKVEKRVEELKKEIEAYDCEEEINRLKNLRLSMKTNKYLRILINR